MKVEVKDQYVFATVDHLITTPLSDHKLDLLVKSQVFEKFLLTQREYFSPLDVTSLLEDI